MELINEETWYLKFKGIKESDYFPWERIDACFTLAKRNGLSYFKFHLKEMLGCILQNMRFNHIKFTTQNFIVCLNRFARSDKEGFSNHYAKLLNIYISKRCLLFSLTFYDRLNLLRKEIELYAFDKSI